MILMNKPFNSEVHRRTQLTNNERERKKKYESNIDIVRFITFHMNKFIDPSDSLYRLHHAQMISLCIHNVLVSHLILTVSMRDEATIGNQQW